MKTFLPFALWAFALALNPVQGQGGSAVITLVMPPPGGEGYSILQSGGMFADGATSTYYNPALLASLERHTGAQVHYSLSQQDLLPVLNLPDLYHVFWGVAAVAPDPVGGTDLGVGFFRNHVSFGENERTDASGQVVSRFKSTEDIYGLGTGIRLGLPVSLGVSAKYIDSRLAQGPGDDGTLQSFAFDLGAVADPTWVLPSAWGLPSAELTPSFSLAVKNLGPDVFYVDPGQADPLPRTFYFGTGLRLRLLDLLDITTCYAEDREVTRRADWPDEPVAVTGFSLGAAFYRYSAGWLDDPLGKRDEKHVGHALEFDLRRLYRMLGRWHRWDFRSPGAAFDRAFPFAPVMVLGLPYRANPRISFGTREIESRDGGIRHRQQAYFLSLSL
jgi:hypothetical protein